MVSQCSFKPTRTGMAKAFSSACQRYWTVPEASSNFNSSVYALDIKAPLAGEPFRKSFEQKTVGDLLRRGVRLLGIGEGDLLHLPAFRNGIAALAQLEGALGVLVADLVPAS